MGKAAVFIGALVIATPAAAGCVVPSPEAGAGFASLALLAGVYAVLRKRKSDS